MTFGALERMLAWMKILTWLIYGLLISATARAGSRPRQPELLEVRKIWDHAPHNAFTDLIRFKGNWFCVFREGQAHVSADGALRVITSKDAQTWTSAALLTSTN